MCVRVGEARSSSEVSVPLSRASRGPDDASGRIAQLQVPRQRGSGYVFMKCCVAYHKVLSDDVFVHGKVLLAC